MDLENYTLDDSKEYILNDILIFYEDDEFEIKMAHYKYGEVLCCIDDIRFYVDRMIGDDDSIDRDIMCSAYEAAREEIEERVEDFGNNYGEYAVIERSNYIDLVYFIPMVASLSAIYMYAGHFHITNHLNDVIKQILMHSKSSMNKSYFMLKYYVNGHKKDEKTRLLIEEVENLYKWED